MNGKEEILQALRETEGYVSGQELCDRLLVTRTSVWKKIRQLQEEGYEIEAVSNRGYRLVAVPDTVSSGEILSRIKTAWVARDVRYFASIDSTNRFAKALGEEGEKEGVLVIADEQTAGRGRSGRSWSTPPGTDIAMSLLLRPNLPPERVSMVTLVMGMAVTRAVNELFNIEAGIKWPNDVVTGGKKLSGTLTEMSAELSMVHYIVIGVGINANSVDFPEEIKDTATSLKLAAGKNIDRAEVVTSVMLWFERYYERFVACKDLSDLKEEYDSMLLNLGQAVRVLDPKGEFSGVARGIDSDGALLVETEGGERVKVFSGEVSVRGIYGYV